MRSVYACCLLLGFAAVADAATLKEAWQRWLKGNYEEARALYETLAKDPKLAPAAAVGLSRTYQSTGDYDKALQVIDAALQGNDKRADLHARRGELLLLRGNWAEAEQAAEKALAQNANDFLARWVRVQVYDARADLKKADDEYRWFVRTYTERSNKDDDVKDPDELLLIALAAAENARWHKLGDQFSVILNDVLGDALKNEKDFWPAEFLAGMLLLEKYNQPEALAAFNKALTINPNAAEVYVGKGLAALQHYELKDAESAAGQALRINPQLPEARRLRAEVHLAGGETAKARADLEKARTVNPRDERTLGKLAACLFLARDTKGVEALVQAITKDDPKPGLFYATFAECLEERKRYDRAETYYKLALEQRPMVPGPLNNLGLLYMRMGREKEAREILTRAFQADEFNVRVSNTLKVLRHLDKYETITTDHFEIRFDPQHDKKLARFMAYELESMYAELESQFQYKPPGRVLVEVFNSHEMFSGRTIALPDLHTVGASTGRMFAMVSPHGKGLRKPFNWARVLRHELVHIFNLEQTDFQVPHWFTEGLAVSNEGFPRPPQWNQLLRERVPAGDLMTLDNVDLGFIKPRNALDWSMAYCQSQLYVEYLKRKFGPKAVGELLAAYKEGLDTAAAIQKVCLVDKPTFEKGYRKYLDEVVQTIQGKRADKSMTYGQLQKAHEEKPGDVDISARLAEQFVLRHDNREARKLVDEVLAKQPKHALASYVKARLLMNAGEDEPAKALLVAAFDPSAPDAKVGQALGKIYYEARDFPKAAELYERLRRADPYETRWLVELVKIYTQLGDKAKQIDVLKDLVPTDADELEQRKKLAQLLLDAKRYPEAERFAREALEIDVRDAEAREVLLQALTAQNKNDEAQRLKTLLGS